MTPTDGQEPATATLSQRMTTPAPAPARAATLPSRGPIARWLRRPDPSTAVILQARGDTQVLPITDPLVDATSGAYHAETRARFWIARAIPAGWLTVFVENNPVPVTDRPPTGEFTAADLQLLKGDMPTRVIMGGMQGRHQPFSLGRTLLVGAALLIALLVGVGAYAHAKGLI